MGKRSALLIGVSEYGEGLEPLPGSLLDVQAMERVMADDDRGAFGVKRLENCDRATMETAIEQFFQQHGTDDIVLFYFSGHGDLGRGGLANQQLHLCASNSAKPQNLLRESTALSASFLKRQMDICKARRIVVILDCCYSGAIGDLLKKGECEIEFGELRAQGRVVLASASSAKVSLQAREGLSLYTQYLLEGMEGAAYSGQGEWIAAKDLHDYADRKFEIVSKGGYQPRIIAEETSYDLPIVRAPKPDAKLEYGKVVDRLLEELDQREGIRFDGQLTKPLVRKRLDISRAKLQIDVAVAQQIETTKQAPYQARAVKRREYTEAFELAVADGVWPDDHDRQLLLEIRQDLNLGESDVVAIEQAVSDDQQLFPEIRQDLNLGESDVVEIEQAVSDDYQLFPEIRQDLNLGESGVAIIEQAIVKSRGLNTEDNPYLAPSTVSRSLPPLLNILFRFGGKQPNEIVEPSINKGIGLDLRAGQLLQDGKYIINYPLETAGFGITYLGTQTESGRSVVIKTLHPSLHKSRAFGRMCDRFVHIATQLALCQHPNVVQVIELFEEGKSPFMVMDYVHGQSLAQLIQSIPMAEIDALYCIREIAAGLQISHRQGLVHGNLKPENLIRQAGINNTVIVGYGISAERMLVGVHYAVPGFPNAFTAPEQTGMTGDRVKSADLYGLAALLYYLLTGQPPIAATEGSLNSQQQLAPLSNLIKPSLQQAIRKGLSLNPQNRPLNIESWLDTLA
jgi:Protein kinase domain/Caspase domain